MTKMKKSKFKKTYFYSRHAQPSISSMWRRMSKTKPQTILILSTSYHPPPSPAPLRWSGPFTATERRKTLSSRQFIPSPFSKATPQAFFYTFFISLLLFLMQEFWSYFFAIMALCPRPLTPSLSLSRSFTPPPSRLYAWIKAFNHMVLDARSRMFSDGSFSSSNNSVLYSVICSLSTVFISENPCFFF